jgi:thermostable 8-oxoguanine DNA glycosylase
MQIKPTQITKFDRTTSELQAFWLFGCIVAGKNSDFAAAVVSKLLGGNKDKNPFDYFRELGEIGIRNALVAARSGNYTRITRFIMESMQLDLATATQEELMAVHGCGPKTASFFLLHSRPNVEVAVLDVHILKYLRSKQVLNAPSVTPTSIKKYCELQKKFLYFAKIDFPHMSIAQIDLLLWMKFSGRLENDEVEPVLY